MFDHDDDTKTRLARILDDAGATVALGLLLAAVAGWLIVLSG